MSTEKVTKVIYTYSPDTMVFTGSDIIPSSQELLVGQTEVEPEQGLYQPITFDGTKWNGTDKAVWQATQDAAYQEYLKEHPELAPKPSVTDQELAALALTVATNKTQQDQTNAQLLLAAAQQTEKETN